MSQRQLRRMWTPPIFRKAVFERKADNPDKKLTEILEDMAKDDFERRKKSGRPLNYF